ncbi:20623_t:CDS:2, partial [Rhizophagus irregularis]
SGIQQSTSTAINNTYKQVFRKNKTEYSEMVVIGFEDEIITNELFQIGISSHKGYYGAGLEFLSTLITKYKGKQSLFIQSIEDNCNLDVYDGDINQYHNEGITPDEIWKSINILNKFDGAALFGITNSYI